MLDDIDSPYLGIVFDPTALVYTGNYHNQVDYAKKGFDLFADRIVAVHLRDYLIVEGQEQVRSCNNGEGILQTETMLNLVNEYRPMVSVVFEETKGESIARVVHRYADF